MSGHRGGPALVATSVLAVVLGGCASGADEAADSSTSTSSDPGLPQAGQEVRLDPADFTASIDNRYWPMKPGTRWVFRELDGEGRALRVVVTVTSGTKEVANGVTARVVRDTVTRDGAVVEDTYDWYAQDRQGTIWYLGEDTAELEGGAVASREGSFEAGVDGAQAGVIMPADPTVGMAYRQEFYAGEAEDRGTVLSLDEMAEVPAGKYEDALLTKDSTPLEPDVVEYKLYAPGVGPVLALGVSGGAGREELIEQTRVDADVASRAANVPLGESYG